jgi:hypothetical protein
MVAPHDAGTVPPRAPVSALLRMWLAAVGGAHDDDASAMMRCRVRWPIRLMAGLLST